MILHPEYDPALIINPKVTKIAEKCVCVWAWLLASMISLQKVYWLMEYSIGSRN
jgi:hypothetical protein